MKKILFAIALGAIMVVSCTKELENNTSAGQTVTIRATSEPYTEIDPNGVVTKGTLDAEGHFIWATGDEIGVRLYKGDNYNETNSGFTPKDATFILSGDGGSSEGTFTYSGSESLDWVNWGYAAFYPKFDSNISNENGNVYFHLKNFYDGYVSGTCLMPMVANASGVGVYRPSAFSFKHVGAGLRVTLKDVPADAIQASLTVTGKNIAAWYGVNPANAGTDCIAATDGTDDTVYLKFGTASEKRDITLIFPLPTVDLSGGITLKLYYDKSGETYPVEFWSRTAGTGTPKLPALTRGQLLDMPDITIPVTPEEASAPIWIDGKTKDWATITHTTTTSSTRILEWKYTQDDNNLYFLYKIDANKIVADEAGSYKWGSYIYIGFDTDNDATKGKSGSGGLGDGMEYRAVVFPWRGTTTTGLECYIGVDEDGHIDDLINSTTSTVNAKVGAKISGGFCYVEVRIPRSSIGSPDGPITVKHAMNYYPTEAKQILPELVTINASDQTVEIGKTVTIGATANSTETISYVSNNEAIATVDANGVITGVAEGSTTITLSVVSVAGEYSAATKNINVTVTAPYIPVISIDGDMTDWDGISSLPITKSGKIRDWKFKSDSQQVYFYFALRKNRVDNSRQLYIGFDTDNDSSTGSSTYGISGLEGYIKAMPYTNDSGASTLVPVEGFDTSSEVHAIGGGTTSGNVKIWDYDAGENPSSDSSNVYIELSIPKDKLNLPASGTTITVYGVYEWGWDTGAQSLTL